MTDLPASPIPLRASRALALHAQGLAAPANIADEDAIVNTVHALGSIQIDSLQVVARSQYLVLWSRLGCYDPAQLDALLFRPGRKRFFEYWKKAASIIPLEHYRFSMPRMQQRLDSPRTNWRNWLEREDAASALKLVRKRIAAEGALRAADFAWEGEKRGAWWDWKPAKAALEYLYGIGELMISDRVNFQRVYDLPERVLPNWVDTSPATREEADRHDVELALRALGICRPRSLFDYTYLLRQRIRPVLDILRQEGKLVTVACEVCDGKLDDLLVHRDRLTDLQRALDGELQSQHTTLLSPFESLLWSKVHGHALWNYHHAIELYVPQPKRKWGYFTLPILHRDRLIGRLDPRLERESNTFHIRALHLEPGIEPDERLVSELAAAIRDFMAFHGATRLKFGRRGNAQFRVKLRRELGA
ncbi:MAG: winged helix DNA-binding domain-containing protein [Anaerolineaceae bacterium]|nr:winged helix DNA-binding domain-containing protein [Anaerolineaceae bacterium]MDE0328635.1 winged helix DNA-binding domain-containing protein [Anaerolineaceae bacterium]